MNDILAIKTKVFRKKNNLRPLAVRVTVVFLGKTLHPDFLSESVDLIV